MQGATSRSLRSPALPGAHLEEARTTTTGLLLLVVLLLVVMLLLLLDRAATRLPCEQLARMVAAIL